MRRVWSSGHRDYRDFVDVERSARVETMRTEFWQPEIDPPLTKVPHLLPQVRLLVEGLGRVGGTGDKENRKEANNCS
jgi:hypothetical protein